MSPPSMFTTLQVLNHPCVAVFQSSVEQLVKDKMPKKSGRWWFSWRRRDMSRSEVRPKTFNSKSGSPDVPDDAFLLFFSKGNQRRRQRNRRQQILLQSSNFCCSPHSNFTFAFFILFFQILCLYSYLQSVHRCVCCPPEPHRVTSAWRRQQSWTQKLPISQQRLSAPLSVSARFTVNPYG